MAVKLSAKKVLKVVGIVAACVVGAFALIFGGVLLFGNNKPVVAPHDLSFTTSSGTIITGGFDLLVITTTADVTETKIMLRVDKPEVLQVPPTAEVGRHFQVFATKDQNGNNHGGVARITAYTENQLVQSQELVIYVDTTANELGFDDFDNNIFSLNSWVNFDGFFNSRIEVLPSNARNPGHLDVGVSPFDRNKTIYYFLLEDNAGSMLLNTGSNVAGFSINGQPWINAINSTQVTSNTVLQVRDEQRYFYVQACMFKNFKDNDYYSTYSNADIFGLLRERSTDLFVMTSIEEFAVQDVRVDDLEATGSVLPLYLYEETDFLAYISDNSLPNFGLRLIPVDNNYDASVLDKFLGGVTITEQDTTYLNITKVAGTSGTGTKWRVEPINFDAAMLSPVGLNVTLKASFTTFEGTLIEKTITVNIKPRLPGIDIVNINYKGMNNFVIDGSKDITQNPEQLSLGGSQAGQKYVTIQDDGSGIITFSNLMFYLNPADIDYIPSAAGTYKTTFDFVKTDGIGPQVMQGGVGFANVSWHYINTDNTTGGVIGTSALVGASGRIRAVCEGLTNPSNVSITFTWADSASNLTDWVKAQYGNDITITTSGGQSSVADSVNHVLGNPEIMRNVKFYEGVGVAPSIVYNTYPYLKVKDKDFVNTNRWITLYVPNEQFNSSTGLIDATDATFSAKGYGEFRVYAVIVATTRQGANIRDINGDYIQYKSAETSVVVTNKIDQLNIYLTDGAGVKLDQIDSGAGDPTVYLPLTVAESETYYLVLSVENTSTPIGLLTQMVGTGFMSLNVSYSSAYGILQNGGKLSLDINSWTEVYDNGNPATGTLIGYSYKIDIGDIDTIEYNNGNTTTSVPAIFKIAVGAQYGSEYTAIKDYFMTVEDRVIKAAVLDFYNGSVSEGSSSKSIWAANMNSGGSIVWNLAVEGLPTTFNGTVVDLTALEHRFYSELGGSVVDGMTPIFELNVDTSIANVIFDGSRYILVIGNVPYNVNGYEIVVTVRPASGNGRFVYTGTTTYSWQVYTEAVASYTFTVYGFEITASETDTATEYVGSESAVVNLFNRINFNITAANGTPVMMNNVVQGGYSNVTLSRLINLSISGGGVFALDGNLMIEVLQDIPSNTTVVVGLKIGLSSFSIAYHNILFTTPFSLDIDGAYQHEADGVFTGKAVIDAPDLGGIDLNTVFEMFNGLTGVSPSEITYQLDAGSLTAAGLIDIQQLIDVQELIDVGIINALSLVNKGVISSTTVTAQTLINKGLTTQQRLIDEGFLIAGSINLQTLINVQTLFDIGVIGAQNLVDAGVVAALSVSAQNLISAGFNNLQGLVDAGFVGLVKIVYNSGDPMLLINNFTGTNEIKIYVRTVIAEVNLGGGAVLSAKEVSLPCVIVLNNLWSEQDITLLSNSDIAITGDGVYNTLDIDLHGQSARLSYINVSKQGTYAGRVDYTTTGNILKVRGFEATEEYQVTLVVTLHFVDGAEVIITKVITVEPNLDTFWFLDDEMGLGDQTRLLNPLIITQTYGFDTLGHDDLLADYIEKAILYADLSGTNPFEVDRTGTNLGPGDAQINLSGDNYTLAINYASILLANPNVNYIILPVLIHVPVYDAAEVKYVITYTIEMKVVLNSVWGSGDVTINQSASVTLPSDNTWYSLDSFNGKHGQTVVGVVVNSITGVDADRVQHRVVNNIIQLKAYEMTVSFSVDVNMTIYFTGGGAADITKTITFAPIEFILENNLGVQSNGPDLLQVVLNDINSYLQSQQNRYAIYLDSTGDHDPSVDFDNDGTTDNDIQHVTFELDPINNTSAILSNVSIVHNDNSTPYDDSDDTYTLTVTNLVALQTAFSGSDYTIALVLMTVFISYDLDGDGVDEIFIETYTLNVTIVLSSNFYDPPVYMSVQNIDSTTTDFMEIQTGTSTGMAVFVDGIEVYNGPKTSLDLTQYLWADGTYQVRVIVYNDALDIGGHHTELDKIFDQTEIYMFSMTDVQHFVRAKYVMNGEIKDYYIEDEQELELLIHHAILYQKTTLRFYLANPWSGGTLNNTIVNIFRSSYPEYDGLTYSLTVNTTGISRVYIVTGFVYYLDKDRIITTAGIEDYYLGISPKPAWYSGLDAWKDTHFQATKVTTFNAGYETALPTSRVFAIDSVTPVLPVYNTEQLFMAVQYGTRPNIEAGSVAEAVYQNARIVLEQINNSNSLTDYEKTLNIYRYLVNRVSYDIVLYGFMQSIGNFTVSSWGNFSVFYLESIFLDLDSQIAVCDGIAKAFVLLCRIEGIYATKVNGTASGGNHAWNEVGIGGNYYWVDATWGVIRDNGGSTAIANHAYFLSNDTEMTLHTATYKIGNNTTISHNYYANYTGQVGLDHYIESKVELTALINAYAALPNFNLISGIEIRLSSAVTFDSSLFSNVSGLIASRFMHTLNDVNKRITYIEFSH